MNQSSLVTPDDVVLVSPTVVMSILDGVNQDLRFLSDGVRYYVLPINNNNLHWSLVILALFNNNVGLFIHYDSLNCMNNAKVKVLEDKMTILLGLTSALVVDMKLDTQRDGKDGL